MCMYACKSRQACKTIGGVWGHVHAPPGNFKLDALRLLLRPFWDRSRAVVATCMARGVLHPIFVCSCMHLLSQLNLNFYERRYYRTAGGLTSMKGQLLISRVPEIAIYLRSYLRVSFHRSGVKQLTRARKAATRFNCTSVILNSSKTIVDHFQTVGHPEIVSSGGVPTPAGTSVFTKHNLSLNGWSIYGLLGWLTGLDIYDLMEGIYIT